MGAYVSLLEYNGIEGMILLSELSRRRIRSIAKLIKVICWIATVSIALPHQLTVLYPGCPFPLAAAELYVLACVLEWQTPIQAQHNGVAPCLMRQ